MGSREVSLALEVDDVATLPYAAFYADCEHEVRPVVAGFRFALVYNLIASDAARIEAPDCSRPVDEVSKILQAWIDRASAPQKLVWILEHQYTPAGFSRDAN